MADSDFVEKYMLEEMKVAQTRMSADIDVMNRYEIYSVTLIGAVLALIFQYRIVDPLVLFIITVLPGLVGVYGHYRCRAHANQVNKYKEYLQKIEAALTRRDEVFVGLVTSTDGSAIKSGIKGIRRAF